MKIKAKIYKADTPNANGIIYSKETLENAVKEFNKQGRHARCGEYLHLPTPSINYILGGVTVEFIGEYVEATITPYRSCKDKFEKELNSCIEIKVLPLGYGGMGSNNSITCLSITDIVCTFLYVNTGNVGKEMYFADIIENNVSQIMHFAE